jgi:hypothetical protein
MRQYDIHLDCRRTRVAGYGGVRAGNGAPTCVDWCRCWQQGPARDRRPGRPNSPPQQLAVGSIRRSPGWRRYFRLARRWWRRCGRKGGFQPMERVDGLAETIAAEANGVYRYRLAKTPAGYLLSARSGGHVGRPASNGVAVPHGRSRASGVGLRHGLARGLANTRAHEPFRGCGRAAHRGL